MSRELGRDDAKHVHPSKTQHKCINEGEFGDQNVEGNSIAYPSETRPQENIPELPLLSNDADNVSILLESDKELEQEIAAFESPDMDGQHISIPNPYETKLEPLNKEVIVEIEGVPIVDRKEVGPIFMEGEVSSVADTSLTELGLVFEEDIMEVSIDDVPLREIGPVIEEYIMEGENVPIDDTSQIELRHVIDEVIMKGGDVPADDMSQTELGSVIEEVIMEEEDVPVDTLQTELEFMIKVVQIEEEGFPVADTSYTEITTVIEEVIMESVHVTVDDTFQTELGPVIEEIIMEGENVLVTDLSQTEFEPVMEGVTMEGKVVPVVDTSQIEFEPVIEEVAVEGKGVPVDDTEFGTVIEEVIMEGKVVPVDDTLQTELEVRIKFVLLEGEDVPLADTSQTELITVIEDVIKEAADITVDDTSQTELGPLIEEIVIEGENVLFADLSQTEIEPVIEEVTMEGKVDPVVDTSQMELEPVIEEVVVEGKGVPVDDTEFGSLIEEVIMEGGCVSFSRTSRTEFGPAIEETVVEGKGDAIPYQSETELALDLKDACFSTLPLYKLRREKNTDELSLEGTSISPLSKRQRRNLNKKLKLRKKSVENLDECIHKRRLETRIKNILLSGGGRESSVHTSDEDDVRDWSKLPVKKCAVLTPHSPGSNTTLLKFEEQSLFSKDAQDSSTLRLSNSPLKKGRKKNVQSASHSRPELKSKEPILFYNCMEDVDVPITRLPCRNLERTLQGNKLLNNDAEDVEIAGRNERGPERRIEHPPPPMESEKDVSSSRPTRKQHRKEIRMLKLIKNNADVSMVRQHKPKVQEAEMLQNDVNKVSNTRSFKKKVGKTTKKSLQKNKLKDISVVHSAEKELEEQTEESTLLNEKVKDDSKASPYETGSENEIEDITEIMEDVSIVCPSETEHEHKTEKAMLLNGSVDHSGRQACVRQPRILRGFAKGRSRCNRQQRPTDISVCPSSKARKQTEKSVMSDKNAENIPIIQTSQSELEQKVEEPVLFEENADKLALFVENIEHVPVTQASNTQLEEKIEHSTLLDKSVDISVAHSSKAKLGKRNGNSTLPNKNADNVPVTQRSNTKLEEKIEQSTLLDKSVEVSVVHSFKAKLGKRNGKSNLPNENADNVPLTQPSNTELEEKIEQSAMLDKSVDISVAHSSKGKHRKRNGKSTLSNENAENVSVTQPNNTELEEEIEQSTLLDKSVEVSVVHSFKAKLGKRNGKSNLPNENADNVPLTQPSNTELEEKIEQSAMLDISVDISVAHSSKGKHRKMNGKSTLPNENAENVSVNQASNTKLEEKIEQSILLDKNVHISVTQSSKEKKNGKSTLSNENAVNVRVIQTSKTELEEKIEQSTLLDKNVDISVPCLSKEKLEKRNGKSTLPNKYPDNVPVTHLSKTELHQNAEEPTLLDKNVDISVAHSSKEKRARRKGKSILFNENVDNVPVTHQSKTELEQKVEKPTLPDKNVVAGPSKEKLGKRNRKSAFYNENFGSMERHKSQICGAKTRYWKYKKVGHVCRTEESKSSSFVELARRSTVQERLLAIGFLFSSVGFLFELEFMGWVAACINCKAVSKFTRRDYWRLTIYYALATCCLVIFKHLFEFLN